LLAFFVSGCTVARYLVPEILRGGHRKGAGRS
jgi:hypothetical protein